jgi:hypothetical protein
MLRDQATLLDIVRFAEEILDLTKGMDELTLSGLKTLRFLNSPKFEPQRCSQSTSITQNNYLAVLPLCLPFFFCLFSESITQPVWYAPPPAIACHCLCHLSIGLLD